MSNNQTLTDTQITAKGAEVSFRKPYQKPDLVDLGDLRALTLGGSLGYGDSSAGYCAEKPLVGPPGGPPC